MNGKIFLINIYYITKILFLSFYVYINSVANELFQFPNESFFRFFNENIINVTFVFVVLIFHTPNYLSAIQYPSAGAIDTTLGSGDTDLHLV